MPASSWEDFAHRYTCHSLGLDAEQMSACAQGLVEIDAGTAIALERAGGPSASWWPKVAGVRELGADAKPLPPPPGRSQQSIALAKGRHMDHPHPFMRWLGDRRVADWAKEHGLSRQLVQAWVSPAEWGQPISRRWAEQIDRESFGAVPVSCWARLR